MAELVNILTDDQKKSAVVDDCINLIDNEVKDKGGLSGMAIKAGYKAVQGVKPGFVRNVVTDLLPEFARVLEPVYQDAKGQSASIATYFTSNSGRVADALLGITDEKAERSKNGLVRGTYQKLRGTAKSHVEAAVPRLGQLIEKYAGG